MAASRSHQLLGFIMGMLLTYSEASYSDAQPQASNQFSDFADGFGRNEQVNDPIAELAAAIPGGGIPGEDYPILASVPDTEFTCDGLLPGYYADVAEEARCQVFHICQEDGREDGFLCPNGTLFNQQFFVCDWWFNFDCSIAQEFFGLNADIGKVDNDAAASNNVEEPSTSYGAPAQNANGNGNGYSNGNGSGYSNGNGVGNGNGRTSVNGQNGNGARKPSGLYQTPN